ncbi:MAG: 23S rRNA (adenine(2030)-N(6))-methyltransferase RlmJ [Proteobacteria bacterium]|nr:23S rRNA (adenine(2030)-N(6))-methyltransferase RlmJ [Pseudomonadota bacterium]
MLAYRHAFHAGNHADVLKHLVLIQVLRYLAAKGKPLRYVDTHAGAGGYKLKGGQAQQTVEYRSGIGALWSRADLPAALADYVALVQTFNRPEGEAAVTGQTPPLALYPGSPSVARMLLPAGTPMRLFETHPADVRTLQAHFGGDRAVQVLPTDGYAGLLANWPPTPRRAVVLMDPSYELPRDYGAVVATLREAVARFAQGVYIVWYPQVAKVEARELARRLTALAPAGWLHARLSVAPPQEGGFGLLGSGVFVLNPPYTLHATLAECLPYLKAQLGQHAGADFLLEHKAD